MDLNYNNGNTSSKSLVVFVGIQILNLAALVTDYLLLQTNSPTITEVSTKHPVLGYFLCGVQIIQPISLGTHLWYTAHPTY